MQDRSRGRFAPSYATVAATLALVCSVLALCLGGAIATGVVVTSKQIKNGTIRSQDIRKAAVRSSDLGTAAVRSSDIKDGAVESGDIGNDSVLPQDVAMPSPLQLQLEGPVSRTWTLAVQQKADFELLATVGSYTKVDPGSVLEVVWAGSAKASASPCVFQLRVDGRLSSGGGGEAFATQLPTNVSVTALFGGLSAGPHQIEVWARPHTPSAVQQFDCTVGPDEEGEIKQTFVISEQVV